MQYRKLGRTGISVSEIGLGCSGFWGDKRFADQSAQGVVREAFDLGVNFFDTGSNYSNFNAEPRLGRALAPIIAAGNREKLVLSTKAGSTSGYAPTVADNDLSSTDFSPEAIEDSCHNSIRNLNSDYLDIFQLHGLNHDAFGDALFDRLLSLKERGLVRCIGINTHFLDEMRMVAERPDVFDMVLMDCNVLQLDRFEIINELVDRGIGVVVGTVLAQGHLVKRKIGSIRNGSFFWYLARSLIKPTTREFQKKSVGMREVLNGVKGMSPTQAAFSYLLANENISSCLFGTTSIQNLREVVAASGLKLEAQDRDAVYSAYEQIGSLSR